MVLPRKQKVGTSRPLAWYSASGGKKLLECSSKRSFPSALTTRRISLRAFTGFWNTHSEKVDTT